ncbi:hypothetical protein ACFSCX_01815 [Bacillus salitolerans]|uniref:Uncharacterized protein n=1 Tax=Bacillus salitolerans TaxID=1437434 RepID=A0ABW4LK28_9BACI
MDSTSKIFKYLFTGSIISWFIWIIIESIAGKGFSYNLTGLIFGLSLTAIALLFYYIYFVKNRKTLMLYLVGISSAVFLVLYVLTYFSIIDGH